MRRTAHLGEGTRDWQERGRCEGVRRANPDEVVSIQRFDNGWQRDGNHGLEAHQ